MRRKQGWLVWLGVFMMMGLFSKASAAEDTMEYTDSGQQQRWEQSQQERAEKAERRRAFFVKWFEGSLEKLKPSRQAHLDDQAAGTGTSMDTGGEVK